MNSTQDKCVQWVHQAHMLMIGVTDFAIVTPEVQLDIVTQDIMNAFVNVTLMIAMTTADWIIPMI